MEGKNKIIIHDDHECKLDAMTPQEPLKHLKNESDYTQTAISIYLETLNTFSCGHNVNSKKKPDSEEEEEEEEDK
jgi:hypothetical protein